MTNEEALKQVLRAVTLETATVLVQAALGTFGDISDEALDGLADALGSGIQRVIERIEGGEFNIGNLHGRELSRYCPESGLQVRPRAPGRD